MATLVLLTLLIGAAWYGFVSRLAGGGLATRIVLAGTGATSQCVGSCLVLGMLGQLTPEPMIGTSLIVAAGLIAAALLARAPTDVPTGTPMSAPTGSNAEPASGPALSGRFRSGSHALIETLRSDLRSLGVVLKESFGWETALLGLMALYAGIWLAAAIVYFPPRGVDDLVYHLPPIYKAVQDHTFTMLPLELRAFFMFPFCGQMLFAWTILLSHSVRWVDGVQAAMAVLGTIAVFAIGRSAGLRARGAALAALSFALMPVVLLQATSNYVDLITNVWLLCALAALLAYERRDTGRLELALGGLATGLLLGSKYQSVVFVFVLVVLAWIFIRDREPTLRGKLVAIACFWLPVMALGVPWYVRNWTRFDNPFYPLPVTLFGATIFRGDWAQGPSILATLVTSPSEPFRIAIKDPGLGTLHGGFGVLFWGFGIPALAWAAVLGIRGPKGHHKRAHQAIVLIAAASLLSFLVTPYKDLLLTPRYVLAAGAFVFVPFALLIEQALARASSLATLLRGSAVVSAGLSVVAISWSGLPRIDLDSVARHSEAQRAVTEQTYLASSSPSFAWIAPCWAALDEMTLGGRGLMVYQAFDWEAFWTAPTFGTELQNHIWNLEKRPDRDPEAYFYYSTKDAPYYLNRAVERSSIALDPRFMLVAGYKDDVTTLYVSRAALREKGRFERLVHYYRLMQPNMVELTAPSARLLDADGLLLVGFPFAGGFLVHQADGLMRATVEPVTSKDVQAVVDREGDRAVYTFGGLIPGRTGHLVTTFLYRDESMAIFRNDPKARTEPMGNGREAPR